MEEVEKDNNKRYQELKKVYQNASKSAERP